MITPQIADAHSDWAGNKRNRSQSPINSSTRSNRVMKKSKPTKIPESQDGVDMISNLPDHVLHMILSRIPSTEDVIQTSILSTRWRYLWTSVPFIDIDYSRGLNPNEELESNGFKEFVYWVLLNKPHDLDRFRLWCANYYDMSTIRRWIHAAVVRKVKFLDLMFCPIEGSNVIEVPFCLVNCGSLEVLRLCLMGRHLRLPKLTGFPALRVLELNDVDLFDDDLVKDLLESCPLLEGLSLFNCDAYDLVISCPKLTSLRVENPERVIDVETEDFLDWKMGINLQISCPKLVFLTLIGPLAHEFLFKKLYSLEKAVIHIKDFYEVEEPTFDLFPEICLVESLSISLYCVKKFYYPTTDEDEPIFLPNLKTLEIIVDDMHVFLPFLECFPDLESLQLIFIKYVYGLDQLGLEDSATISLLTHNLKKVEFLEFDEEKPKLAVARALLEHGNELEEMVFSWGDEARFHERSKETMKEVSKFHKASSTVKLRYVINPTQVELRPVPEILETDSIQVESSKCSSNSSIKCPAREAHE